MDPSFLQQLFKDSRKMRKGADTTAYEALMGFYHAVAWRDPGVMALLAFPVAYGLVCLALRNHPTVHIALFLLTCGLSYSAAPVNAFLGARWRDFGFSQNYFDKHGVFMSSLFCAPLLLIAFAQMVRGESAAAAAARCKHPPHSQPRSFSPSPQLFSLVVSCRLLVTVKRAELKQKYRDQKKLDAAEAKKQE